MEEWLYIVIGLCFLFLYSLLIAIFDVIAPLTKNKVDDVIRDILDKQKDLFLDFIKRFKR